MREEAYTDYVERARRRLKSLKKAEAVAQKQPQQQQHQQKQRIGFFQDWAFDPTDTTHYISDSE